MKFTGKTGKAGLLNMVALAAVLGVPSVAAAQDASGDEEIVVTGYRAALQNSTAAKRASTSFSDSIFAEDIGKFPDLNIAESLTRIPGIQLARDATGEGLTVSIRGLGTNFTKVTLNGSQIAVATPGGIDSGESNREVDLDMFPTELFTRLDVSKSPSASLLEGGVSGNINMRSARPFDNPGTHLTYQAQYGHNTEGDNFSPRAALIGSWTSEDEKFGVLVGVAGVNLNSTITGYESVGWSTPATGGTSNFTCTGCTQVRAGNDIRWGPTVPVNAGNGLTTGATVNDAFLLANNPGMTLQQISEGLLPRLGRLQYLDGTRNRVAGLVSLEFRPTQGAQFYLDVLGAIVDRDFYRSQMNWVGRNSNFMVPTNLEIGDNNVITSGTFANAMWFVEDRNFREDADLINVNPGAHFEYSDWLTIDLQFNYSHSVYFRDAPTVLFNTLPYSGVTVNYDNTNSDGFPSIQTNVDLNDPANFGWLGMSVDANKNYTTGLGNNGRVNVQNEKRNVSVWGAHWDARIGNDTNNLKIGLAYDELSRSIFGYDNSEAWQNYVCGGGVPTARPPSPPNAATTQPLCTGSATPQFAPGVTNGYTAGAVGSAVPNSAVASYLRPGPGGWVQVDWDAFRAATNYEFYNRTAPPGTGISTGGNSGTVNEEIGGAYVEANGATEFLAHEIRFNAGGRYVITDQKIGGPVSLNGVLVPTTFSRTYDAFLPSLNVAADLADDVILRFAGSRTLTRPNPNDMTPATNFGDPSAAQASQGNPDLRAFTSNNFDIGLEWYTGGEGYLAATFFNKQITGFSANQVSTVPFLSLNIPYEALAPNQKTAIDSRGGPNVATVQLTQRVNLSGVLNVRGYELNWVQPLDVVLEGLGFSASYTRVNQSGEGAGAPTVAIGTSPVIYNVTPYYENHGVSVRLSYTYQDAQVITGPNQNGIGGAQLRSDERGQWDMSASYAMDWLPSSPSLTLNAINLTEEPLRTTFEWPNAAYNYRNPGRQILIGIRGTF